MQQVERASVSVIGTSQASKISGERAKMSQCSECARNGKCALQEMGTRTGSCSWFVACIKLSKVSE